MIETERITVHILSELKEGPWGGGNQFLKALRNKLADLNCYEEIPSRANVILFNSYPFKNEGLFKKSYLLVKSGKAVVHRVDGPIQYTRGKDREIDDIIFDFNRYFTNGTVFQSSWSQARCHELGFGRNLLETVILNACDEKIFYSSAQPRRDPQIKIIALTWSTNPKKGFDIYQFLDKNLDFTKYQLTLLGNSPVHFKNIRHVAPLRSEEVATQLRNHDLFITASVDDPCSNSLIEALCCGLPAVARRSGGHPEILGKAGKLFNDKTDVLAAIDQLASHLETCRQKIDVPSMDETAHRYYHFCKEAFLKKRKNPSNTSYFYHLNLMRRVYQWKFSALLRERMGENLD